ncbi:MAG TPA: hypothetical protein VN176_14495 [Verrucomicrobiae bacterium]|jgi:hypothetical protein|nr:hypothetical protein [Verrucomicrobiae bacterium]
MSPEGTRVIRVHADFNGVFQDGRMLCLSHGDTSTDEDGNKVILCAGMLLTAFDEDTDEHGNRDNLIATGTVEPAPDWLRKHGSKWVLMTDENGVSHESDLQENE